MDMGKLQTKTHTNRPAPDVQLHIFAERYGNCFLEPNIVTAPEARFTLAREKDLQEKPDVLIPALTGIGGFVSGFAGGWGFGRKQDN